MKTTEEWLNELPAEAASKALENTPKLLLNVPEESLKSAILGAFAWYKSPEGHNYWQEIYDSL